jgi:hypothetical protein
MCFPSHLPFGFLLEGNFLANKILWSNKFLGYPLVEFYFFENQDDLCFSWYLKLWILTTWTSHSYSFAYYRPIHLISTKFQNIDNNPVAPPKNFFLPSIVIILQSVWSLWLRFLLQCTRIVKYKILRLKVLKNHFILVYILHANTYIFKVEYTPKCS